MKRKYLIIYILLLSFLLILGYFLIDLEDKNIGRYINSTFFQSIVTFSVGIIGLSVWGIYQKQQEENKSDIAKAIILEIRNAENNILDFKSLGNINNSNKGVFYTKINILNTNTWTKNINLFLDVLDEDDINLINNFYESCDKLNRELFNIQNIKNIGITEKAKQSQKFKIDILNKLINDEKDLNNIKDNYHKLFNVVKDNIIHDEDYWFESYVPIRDFMEIINNLTLVLNTTTFEKIKKISNLK